MNNSLKQEIDFVIKRNGFLAEERIKTRLSNYCLDIRAETIFMNTENSKTSEPHKFALSLQQRLDLKSSDKYVALQSLPIYYTWKNIRQQHKHNKLKVIISPIWNNEFELLDGSYSVSDIQNHMEYIIKNMKH